MFFLQIVCILLSGKDIKKSRVVSSEGNKKTCMATSNLEASIHALYKGVIGRLWLHYSLYLSLSEIGNGCMLEQDRLMMTICHVSVLHLFRISRRIQSQ